MRAVVFNTVRLLGEGHLLSNPSPRLNPLARQGWIYSNAGMRNFVMILWLLGPGRQISGSRTEDSRIIQPATAMALELVGIAA